MTEQGEGLDGCRCMLHVLHDGFYNVVDEWRDNDVDYGPCTGMRLSNGTTHDVLLYTFDNDKSMVQLLLDGKATPLPKER